MKHVRLYLWICITALLLMAGTLSVAAENETSAADVMPDAYLSIEESLPEDLLPSLPDGLFSEDPHEALAAVQEATTFSFLIQAVMDALGLCLDDALRLLCTLVGILLVTTLLRRLSETVGGKGGEILTFALRLVLYAAIVGLLTDVVEDVTLYFSQQNALTVAMIPAMGVLLALGGNTGQAVIHGELLAIFVSILGYIGTAITPPLCGVCMALALPEALGSRVPTAHVSATVKKWYVSVLGLIMFLLGVAMTLQTTLTARADRWAMRGVKYAVGQWIPVVGGTVSGTLGTVASAVEMMRSVCGGCGILLVALLLLPTLLRILILRVAINLSATVAALLSCEGEGKLLNEVAGLYGYLAAAISIGAVVFVLALGLFMGSAAALA